MKFRSESEAEAAYYAYSQASGCSRMNAAFFIDNDVPEEYVYALLGGGATTGNSGITAKAIVSFHRATVKAIVGFHRAGVDPGYISSCLASGVKLERIPELWADGIPIEYLQVLAAR